MKYTRDKRRFRKREIAAHHVKTAMEKLFMSFLHGALLKAQVIRRRARARALICKTTERYANFARLYLATIRFGIPVIWPHVNSRDTSRATNFARDQLNILFDNMKRKFINFSKNR